jgi:hypothetical protein
MELVCYKKSGIVSNIQSLTAADMSALVSYMYILLFSSSRKC